LGNRAISFGGKAVTVRSVNPTDPQTVSNTVIDCNGERRGFMFQAGEGENSKLQGLTIINGKAAFGGGIYCNNSSPSIANCIIVNCSAMYGGGIACLNNLVSGSSPRITNCQVKENSASSRGGGIYCIGASPSIENSIISGNSAIYGGAIYSYDPGDPLVDKCTITANAALVSGAGIYCGRGSNIAIGNTILWGDTAPIAAELLVGSFGAPTEVRISYCDVQDPDLTVTCYPGCTIDWVQGNVDVDPGFVDAGGDYHLRGDSGCIDAGDPDFAAAPDETDIDGQPRLSGKRLDIGADEYQATVTTIAANVDLKPETLNLNSNRRWLTCIITLPDGYDVADVDAETIMLEAGITPARTNVDLLAQQIVVKFEPALTRRALGDAEGQLSLTVTGSLRDGTGFEGADGVRVLRAGR
ncbi:MAG: choice-of-anchor Q domain-containing protein, partial [Planctomycetota bacterium]